jgi:hypothetical protein
MILFVTDNITSLNGMSVFSNNFINWMDKKFDESICVFEVQSNHFIAAKKINNDKIIKKIFVNGHYSNSDKIIRNNLLRKKLLYNNFILDDDCTFTIISHGWHKVKNRFSIYNLLYNIKNYIKTSNINSIAKHYNSIIFISNKCDDYRHYDYKWSIKNNFKFEYIDFTKQILVNNSTSNNVIFKDYILVISNFDTAKNLFLLFKINIFNKIKRNKNKNFILLTTKPKLFLNKIIYKLLVYAKVNIIFDQTQKKNLISNCNYLFIPSHTEYLPIVAFEAFSMNKNVLSYYFIISLSEYKKYRHIKK